MKSNRLNSYLFVVYLALFLCIGLSRADDQYTECKLADPKDAVKLTRPFNEENHVPKISSFRKDPNSIIAWAYYARTGEIITSFGVDASDDPSHLQYEAYHNNLLDQATILDPDYTLNVKYEYSRPHRCPIIHSLPNRDLSDIWLISNKQHQKGDNHTRVLTISPDINDRPKRDTVKVALICSTYNEIPREFTERYNSYADCYERQVRENYEKNKSIATCVNGGKECTPIIDGKLIDK